MTVFIFRRQTFERIKKANNCQSFPVIIPGVVPVVSEGIRDKKNNLLIYKAKTI